MAARDLEAHYGMKLDAVGGSVGAPSRTEEPNARDLRLAAQRRALSRHRRQAARRHQRGLGPLHEVRLLPGLPAPARMLEPDDHRLAPRRRLRDHDRYPIAR